MYYIKTQLKIIMSSSPQRIVEHMFASLGNGVKLDGRGFLVGNYRSSEVYTFDQPQPFPRIYPWNATESFQPFRNLAGCRDVGFKETAQYFIDCIMITPNDVEFIKQWKQNIDLVKQVLIDTPTITDRYQIDDMDKFLSDIETDGITNQHGSPNETQGNPSVTKKWFFDVQWSDCPELIEKEVKQIWRNQELGNDNYIWKTVVDVELFTEYPRVYFWLKHNGVPENEDVIIHWWW